MTAADLAAYLDALSAIVRPVRAADYPRPPEPYHALLHMLGNPQELIPAVIVAGSVGKGTACHRIAAALQARGVRVGTYTSPHLHSFRERYLLDGAIITRRAFIAGVQAVRAAARAAAPDHAFSTFELATALALWWFAQERPDSVVMEVGLGGRFDAVGMLPGALAVFTPIETEHAAMLGGTLETIAWHKAGIMRAGMVAVSVPQPPPVMRVLHDEAARVGAHLTVEPQPLPLTLFIGAHRPPAHGGQPVSVTLLPMLTSGQGPGAPAAELPARGERVRVHGRDVLIDGGHTPGSARWLRGLIELLTGIETPVRLVLAMLADKNAAGYLSVFDSPRFHITLTQTGGHRAAAPEALAEAAVLQRAEVDIAPDMDEALLAGLNGPEALVVVCGSLRLAAAAREMLGLVPPDLLEEARSTRALFEDADYLGRIDQP